MLKKKRKATNTILLCFAAQVFGNAQDGQRCHLQAVAARSGRDAAILFDRADSQLSQPIHLGRSATQLQATKNGANCASCYCWK